MEELGINARITQWFNIKVFHLFFAKTPGRTEEMNQIAWTNPSVKALAGSHDPIKTISDKTKELVLKAMDDGWQGPPFDPFWLAKHLGIPTVPRDDILDSRVQASPSGKPQIEYNPNQPHSRTRFSVAHEIAHTLFPDYVRSTRNRSGQSARSDDWQLELLCNISAAEILMPAGPSLDLADTPITVNNLMRERKRFDVSIEALLIRIAKLTDRPITVFVASRTEDDTSAPYKIDYAVNSATSTLALAPGFRVPKDSVLEECSAIGFSAEGRETWSKDLPEFDIQCIGIPPYRNTSNPRVVGVLHPKGKVALRPTIKYVLGDATQPRGKGHRIIAHVVQDKTPNWGRGFALAVAKKWPTVQTDFREWVSLDKDNLSLGESHLSEASEEVNVFHMIAQHGYGPSAKPRIRYSALKECLSDLAVAASNHHASVHMPRIGTGYAMGNWGVIKELIEEALVRKGFSVTIYDLPGQENRPRLDLLDFFSSFD